MFYFRVRERQRTKNQVKENNATVENASYLNNAIEDMNKVAPTLFSPSNQAQAYKMGTKVTKRLAIESLLCSDIWQLNSPAV